MRKLMWASLVVGFIAAVFLGCVPPPVAAESNSTPAFNLTRECDPGLPVCCYTFHEYRGVSCVQINWKANSEYSQRESDPYARPRIQGGTRVLGQSILGGTWENQ